MIVQTAVLGSIRGGFLEWLHVKPWNHEKKLNWGVFNFSGSYGVIVCACRGMYKQCALSLLLS